MSDEPKTGQELETLADTEKSLVEGFQAGLDVDAGDVVVPILKVAQQLTKEVQDDDDPTRAGDLVNGLSGENFGKTVEFIVAGFYKGRFRANKDGEIICAGPSVAADGTPLKCGCHDLPYPECPDAEEQYKARVNAGDMEWGDGPPVSTTYNFIGLVVGSEMPVKLSLMRAAAKDAKKLLTMLKFRRAPWDTVFTLSTDDRANRAGQKFKGVTIKQGRRVTADERQAAVSLAQAIRTQSITEVGEDSTDAAADARPEEPAEGALDY